MFDFWVTLITIVAAMGAVLTFCGLLILVERRVAAFVQDRLGPNRVGPFGLLQPLADGLKFILKEDITPPHVYKPLYIAAPMLSVTLALLSISVVPFGESFTWRGHPIPLQITDVNIGLLIILGVTSIAVYGIALSGWSSNSKYSLLGGLR